MNHSAEEPTTGQRKEKKVKRSVIIIDRIAEKVITIGGIMVIMAVLGILFYLVQQTLPLFRAGEINSYTEYHQDMPTSSIIGSGMDEYRTISFIIFRNGTVRLFHTKTGAIINQFNLDLAKSEIKSFSKTIDKQHFAFGFADGTVRLAEIRFPYEILTTDQMPKETTKLDDVDARIGNEIVTEIPGGQFRRIHFEIILDKPIEVSTEGNAIVAVDYRVSGKAERQTRAFVSVESSGKATLNRIKTKFNLLTGQKKLSITRSQLPALENDSQIHSVLMNDRADMVLIATKDGRAYRYDTTDFSNPILAEVSPMLEPGVMLTGFGFLNGGQSIIVGGSDGSLNIFFVINDKERGAGDGKALVKARSYGVASSTVTGFTPSSRDKSFAVAYADGSAAIIHATSRKRLLNFEGRKGRKIVEITLSPRFDGLLHIYDDGLIRFSEFSVPHPETTFFTLFQKVWYEGYKSPTYTWQSSAATDDYEQKLSLVPLIFGSIKAALYSLLFAIPIAILGAIYTSEFVDFRIRNTIKPAMEMMASLPSVVLGFVAALVMAPIVETWIAAVLAAFIVIPLSLLLGSLLWQLLPQHLIIRWQGAPKLILMFLFVILAIATTRFIGPLIEDQLFHGNFKAWLNRDVGTAEPFLFLVLLPLVFLVTSSFFSWATKHYITKPTAEASRVIGYGFDIIYWVLIAGSSIFLTYELAQLFAFFGLDARGNLIDTYVQRNTLVVGFAMGFAVIPIIYTIAEDALYAVPDHLRAASLGCGATQWQTTIYVILPAAVSGVFSAIMIGMGRAVGETMIVVMAAGNTPIMDWNIFNGLRALSATIAVELPEAVKDGTLYRVLFLSGLVLFAMTFVINTIAEIVRLRFRKKTTQL
ncbi:ABC transporter permease subunit [bacterium]|nr:ABC transporter permease subunit [bacterium]